MNLPFILGVGSLEIEERRPRSATEPRVKRLYFTKNRRHVTDDVYRGRRGSSDNWAMVPYNGGRRRQNQIEEWDRRKADAQLRFNEQEYRHRHHLNTLQLQHDDERLRRQTLEARQLNDIILQGQNIPPQYWQRMQDIQRMQHMQRMPPPNHGRDVPPAPPEHGHPEDRGGHGGHDPRIMHIAPPGRQGRGPAELPFEEHREDEFEHENRHGNGRRGRSRSSRRGCHDDFAHDQGNGGHHGHGEQDDDIVRLDTDSEDDDHPPRRRRINGGHEQHLPSVFGRPRRSRSRAHRSHSRPRNHSRMSSGRRHSRPRQYYVLDDSDTESEHELIPIIRPRSRGSLRRRSRHYEDTSSDDSFEHYTPRPRFRLSSKTRRRGSRH